MEVAARTMAGFGGRVLRFRRKEGQAEIGVEELLLRHAFNMPASDALREAPASGVMMIPVPASGILESVSGVEASRATPRITELIITARLNDYIAAWPDSSSYLAFLFAKASTA